MSLFDELAKLRDLQKIDTKIYQREMAMKALDSGETLKAEAVALLKRHDAAESVMRKAEATQRDQELAVKSLEEKRKAVNDKLYGGRVTNPKELENLQKDEEMIRHQISTLEDSLLEAMDAAETARAEEAQLGAALAKAKRAWQETVARTKAETERLTKEIAELKPGRDQLAATIEKPLLRRYDEIRTHTEGIGLAATDSGICAACHVTLNRDITDKIIEGVEIVLCESCGRILAPAS